MKGGGYAALVEERFECSVPCAAICRSTLEGVLHTTIIVKKQTNVAFGTQDRRRLMITDWINDCSIAVKATALEQSLNQRIQKVLYCQTNSSALIARYSGVMVCGVPWHDDKKKDKCKRKCK